MGKPMGKPMAKGKGKMKDEESPAMERKEMSLLNKAMKKPAAKKPGGGWRPCPRARRAPAHKGGDTDVRQVNEERQDEEGLRHGVLVQAGLDA
jgi:hypothetical protein